MTINFNFLRPFFSVPSGKIHHVSICRHQCDEGDVSQAYIFSSHDIKFQACLITISFKSDELIDDLLYTITITDYIETGTKPRYK